MEVDYISKDTPLSSLESQTYMSSQKMKKWRDFFLEEVNEDLFLELQLLGLAIAAGINDATTYPDYKVFASNQTGNTALLAVGSLNIAGERIYLPNIAFSLVSFILGGWFLGQLGDRFGRKRRAWLLATNTFQTALVFAAAALRRWVVLSHVLRISFRRGFWLLIVQ